MISVLYGVNINKVEICSTIKQTAESTIITYLSTSKRQLLWSSWPAGFHGISLLEEYENCL